MQAQQICVICQRKAAVVFNQATALAKVECPRCGNYHVSEVLSQRVGSTQPVQYYLYSGAIRELNEHSVIPTIDDFSTLLSQVRPPRNPLEQMDRILLSLQNTLDKAGAIKTYIEDDYAIGYAKDNTEFAYLIRKMKEIGYLHSFSGGGYDSQIEIHGWRRLVELAKDARQSDQAFVAMRFHTDYDYIFRDGIEPALVETGYVPLRVDRREHNEKIDDFIIAQIRRSSLLVADFTSQNQGVYFEAGFAMGLDIPVIRTCLHNETDKLHFDIRQYNHILWKDTAELKKRLIDRIDATAPLKTT